MIKEQAVEVIEDLARQLGMYVENADWLPAPEGGEFLVVNLIIGDIAFTDRIQNPEKYGTDHAVALMEKQLLNDDFLDQREKLRAALESGVDVLEVE